MLHVWYHPYKYIYKTIDELNANVLALDKYDMILSMAWLHECNPIVNYRNKSITFEHNNKTITLHPMPIDADMHTSDNT